MFTLWFKHRTVIPLAFQPINVCCPSPAPFSTITFLGQKKWTVTFEYKVITYHRTCSKHSFHSATVWTQYISSVDSFCLHAWSSIISAYAQSATSHSIYPQKIIVSRKVFKYFFHMIQHIFVRILSLFLGKWDSITKDNYVDLLRVSENFDASFCVEACKYFIKKLDEVEPAIDR